MFYEYILPQREQLVYFLPLIPEIYHERLYEQKLGMIGCVWEADARAAGALLFEEEEDGFCIRWCAVSPDEREQGCAHEMVLSLQELARRAGKGNVRAVLPAESSFDQTASGEKSSGETTSADGFGAGFRRILERIGYEPAEGELALYYFQPEDLEESVLLNRVREKMQRLRRKNAFLLTELKSSQRMKVLEKLNDMIPEYSGRIREDLTAVCLGKDGKKLMAAAVVSDLMEPDLYLAWLSCVDGGQKELMQALVRAAQEAQKDGAARIYFAAGEEELALEERLTGKSAEHSPRSMEMRISLNIEGGRRNG